MLSHFNFEYQDNGYIRKSEFIFTRLQTCIRCHEDKGRGFKIQNEKPFDTHKSIRGAEVGFVCLDCMPNLLNELGHKLEEKQELGFFELGLLKKYSQLYMKFNKDEITLEYFNEQQSEFSKYIYKEVMQVVEFMTNLDFKYGQNIASGTQWDGWWMGATGDDMNLFLSWLKTSICYDGYENPVETYRQQNGKRVPIAVRGVQHVVQGFFDKICKEKKFR